MKLLCFSDIHGNVNAVKAMVDDVHQKGAAYDAIIFAGDFTNVIVTCNTAAALREFQDTIDLIKSESKQVFFIFGNRDLGIIIPYYQTYLKEPISENVILLEKGKKYSIGEDISITSDWMLVDEKTILVEHDNNIGFHMDEEGIVIGGPFRPIIREADREQYVRLKKLEQKAIREIKKSQSSEVYKAQKSIRRDLRALVKKIENYNGGESWYSVSEKALLHIAGHTHTGCSVRNYLNTGALFKDSLHNSIPSLGCYFDVEIEDGKVIKINCNKLGDITEYSYNSEIGLCKAYSPYSKLFKKRFILC